MADAPRLSLFRPFRHRTFRSVWIANTVSNFGGLIEGVGAAWMMVLLSAPASMVALVQASKALPVMLLSLMAGAIADQFDRRRVLIGAQWFLFLASAGLCLVTFFDVVTPWLLLVFTFLIGCGNAFNRPAWQSSVGEMVPREDLAGAVTLNSMGFNLARSVGPAVGGMIVAAFGAAAAFAFNVLSYLGLIGVLGRWHPELPERTLPRERIGDAMAAGVRYVAMSPHILVVLVRSTLFGVGSIVIQALLPLVARDLVGGGSFTYGVLLGAFGIGAVGGAVGSGVLHQRLSTEGVVRIASLAFAIATVIAGVSPFLPLTLLALAITGAAWIIVLSSFNTVIQLAAPRWVVGRALALYQMATFGGMALGSWVWGVVADLHHVGTALIVAGLVQIVALVVALPFRLAPVDDLDLAPLRDFTAPDTDVPVNARSGPVVVTISYDIAEQDEVAFLTVMAERRRIRRRDGARHWHLLRDLADRTRWIERYHVPTWLDYVRHNQRRTRADAAVTEELRRLHRGAWPPPVTRMLERDISATLGDRLGNILPGLRQVHW
ncbi:MFS transporter [Hephaestia sp. GCM10023244]|uniref:MFS transporter n=1 Tax=unclassified Hephaestia TaxID=2631281 RepID=UPI002076E32A|nr:MFS transporter [Hephaestia sp. MAHUQ-44]MCM8729571.1 MFS transporter [Hephaestia sp. MAHUQ-44]